jgi:hypothetical protein
MVPEDLLAGMVVFIIENKTQKCSEILNMARIVSA